MNFKTPRKLKTVLLALILSQAANADNISNGSTNFLSSGPPLGQSEIYRLLTTNEFSVTSSSSLNSEAVGSERIYPQPNLGSAAKIAFTNAGCHFNTGLFTFMPGNSPIFADGISTAGTLKQSLEEERQQKKWLQKRNFQHPETLNWQLFRCDKRGGFILLEDETALRFSILSDGSLWLAGLVMNPISSIKSKDSAEKSQKQQVVTSSIFNNLIGKNWTLDSATQDGQPSKNLQSAPKYLRFEKNGDLEITTSAPLRGHLLRPESKATIKRLAWSIESRDGEHFLEFYNVSTGACESYPGGLSPKVRIRFKSQKLEIEVHPNSKLSTWQIFSASPIANSEANK